MPLEQPRLKKRHKLSDVCHKYGFGFPLWKRLMPEDFRAPGPNQSIHLETSNTPGISMSTAWSRDGHRQHSLSQNSDIEPNIQETFSSVLNLDIDKWASQLMSYLIHWADIQIYGNESCFELRMKGESRGHSPKWAFHFHKMKGIIRQPGLLLVQIYDQKADLSMPAWYSHANLLLLLINSIYVCRLVSSHIGPEAFSDIFGGQEQRISPCLHATLIASLAIISIVGGNQNAETLVESILWAAPESCKSIPELRTTNWQVVNGKKYACESHSLHK